MYNAGYQTVAALANAAPIEIEHLLKNAVPFDRYVFIMWCVKWEEYDVSADSVGTILVQTNLIVVKAEIYTVGHIHIHEKTGHLWGFLNVEIWYISRQCIVLPITNYY